MPSAWRQAAEAPSPSETHPLDQHDDEEEDDDSQSEPEDVVIKTSPPKTNTSSSAPPVPADLRQSFVYRQFLHFLETGCGGSPTQGYPALVVILSTIPSEVKTIP